MTYVDLRPATVRPLQVLVDGVWRGGDLEAYAQTMDGPLIHWRRRTYLGWLNEELVTRT